MRQRLPDCIQLTDVPWYLSDFVTKSAVTVMIFVSVSVNKTVSRAVKNNFSLTSIVIVLINKLLSAVSLPAI